MRQDIISCFVVAIGLCFSTTASAQSNLTAPEFPVKNYTTSWLGNSFGGPDWVQRYVGDMWTAPDGTCYTATGWDEGAREFGIYKDGKVIGKALDSHGWGYSGGTAVTGNSQYLFIAQRLDHSGKAETGEQWPPTHTTWYGVGRRKLDGTLAPFPGGKGPQASAAAGGVFLPVNAVKYGVPNDITGLAASPARLFVSNGTMNEVDVYDANSMAKLAAWPVPGAGRLAYDASTDSVWVVGVGESGAPAVIHQFSVNGKSLGAALTLPAGVQPVSICATTGGRLLVGDNGPGQQILIIGALGNAPKVVGTFGTQGGIYSGTPGQVAPLKFSTPWGVGSDAAGNIYVSNYEAGVVMESYRPDGVRIWELHGLEFIECADLDPGSPDDAYTAEHHYVLDLAQPSGQDSRYAGYLVDKFGYPDDPRLHNSASGSVFVRRIHGQRVLFGLDMNAGNLQIYRFTGHGELTAPAGFIRTDATVKHFPPNQPEKGGWLWRDANGDGHFDAGDYEPLGTNIPVRAWSVDDAGGIWLAYITSYAKSPVANIRHLPCEGLDAVGNPIYHWKSALDRPPPAPFDDIANSKIERMQYDTTTDTMYLSGFTAAHPDLHNDWKTSGPVICRYDHWSQGPVKRWEITVPFEPAQVAGSTHETPDAFSVAGDKLFNGYLRRGEIRVYNTADGSYAGSLLPGPEVDNMSGWIDTMYGVRARQLRSGEYLVFAEEVYHEKVLMYRVNF